MTPDDEAFVRAVVDRPGDDLPRLVYADWLDERGDPRGPYLRAEVEWAKPWMIGLDPPDDALLQQMSSECDPIWIAQVSRPPMGVCCQTVLVGESGVRHTREDVRRFEMLIGNMLPCEYAALLLNYGGGSIGVRRDDFIDSQQGWHHGFRRFRSYLAAECNDVSDQQLVPEPYRVDEIDGLMLPIGEFDRDIDILIIALSGPQLGSVFIESHAYLIYDDLPQAPAYWPLAPTLGRLLSITATPRGRMSLEGFDEIAF